MAEPRRTWLGAVALCICVCAGSRVVGDDGAKLFDEFYASAVREAIASRDPDRILGLARDVLKSAAEPDVPAGLRLRLLEAAHDLASRVDAGHDLAIEAVERFGEAFPDQRGLAFERSIALRQAYFARSTGEEKVRAAADLVGALESAADHHLTVANDTAAAENLLRRALSVARSQRLAQQATLTDRLNVIRLRRGAQLRIERSTAAFDADPTAEHAHELVMAYVVDLDDPGAAKSFTEALEDESLKRCTLLAAQSIATLRAPEARELGDWYRQLAAKTNDAVRKRPLLTRAEAYYRFFLDSNDAAATDQLRVRLLLDQTTGELAQLGGAASTSSTAIQAVWNVVFESDDPLAWDPKDAPEDMRYLRLRRMDTGEFVVIAVTHEQLRGKLEGERFVWNGTNETAKGVHYLGIGNKQWRNQYRQGSHVFRVTDHKDGYGGWGFGRRSLVNSGQVQMWNNATIAAEDKVVMQIAVTAGPLSSAEKQRFLE